MRGQRISFPWWFRIINYIISFIFVVISIFFIIAKGISLGNDLCNKWLLTVLFSTLTSFFISEPLTVFLFYNLIIIF
jgi:hypothetical protein